MIEAQGVSKSYNKSVVLQDINTTITEGEFLTLVGASGCGKSTFLRMLLGVETPSTGQIMLDGSPIAHEPGPDRGIVFQQYSVFPHLTVLGNVMAVRRLQQNNLTGYLSGPLKKSAMADAMEILDSVGLNESLKRYPHELSGGMKQRLAIAQTLLAEPRVLLLDEPFAALDPGIKADMHELVIKLWQRYKLTVVMVTHSLQEGFYLGTRLIVFDKTQPSASSAGSGGATITYDIPVKDNDLVRQSKQKALAASQLIEAALLPPDNTPAAVNAVPVTSG